nr:hypothetical protein [Mesorhizobium sp. B2-4-15]
MQQHAGRRNDENAAGREKAWDGGQWQAQRSLSSQGISPATTPGAAIRKMPLPAIAENGRIGCPRLIASELNDYCLISAHQVFFGICEQSRPELTFSRRQLPRCVLHFDDSAGPIGVRNGLDHSLCLFACVCCKIDACFLGMVGTYIDHLLGAFSSH